VSRAARTGGLVLVALVLAAVGGQAQAPPASPGAQPYRRGGQEPLDFRGPGREAPEPDVAEVVLGWFGPGDPDHPEFGTLWRGALLALDQENAAGGYEAPASTPGANAPAGKPFRLVPAWSESPWQAGIADLVRVVYDRGAWAVIGGVDGTSTHLAVQVALKSHFLLLSPGSTDVSTERANVPWLFSLPPGDEATAPVLVAALARAVAGGGGFAVAASTDHATHATLAAVRKELERRRLVPRALVEFAPAEADAGALIAHLLEGGPRAVVVLAPAVEAGRLVAALRAAGFGGTVLGGPTAASDAFRVAAGDAAEGVVAPRSIEPGARWAAFAAAYEERWGTAPDEPAARGYDAVELAVAAVRRAGLNRARVRDAVRALAPWSGAAGTVTWDALGRNQAPVSLGRWTAGRFVPAGAGDPRHVAP
jgi:branched-chain amino acid transport system substrate-binding protein